MLNQQDQALAGTAHGEADLRLPRGFRRLHPLDPQAATCSGCGCRLDILLVVGGFLAILRSSAMWMTPLGLLLLAQDFAPVRRGLYRLVNWTAAKRPHWFGEQPGYS
jgi:hypothetical protein